MARAGAVDVLTSAATRHGADEIAGDYGGPPSTLLRWVENPMRTPALVVYTLAANAGIFDDPTSGAEAASAASAAAALAALRRCGEWHNLVAFPAARPAVTYVVQLMSTTAVAAADDANERRLRGRGVEWFLLAQAATGLPPGGQTAVAAALRPVPLVPSQVGLVVQPSIPVLGGRASEAGAMWVAPNDTMQPWQAVPLAGLPWGLRGVGVWVPLLEVHCPATVMQLVVDANGGAGVTSPLLGLGARRLVPNYLAAVRAGVSGGAAVSLLRLHAADVRAALAAEAAVPVAPDSPVWLTGVDRAVVHYCRDDLASWVREGGWMPGERAAAWTRTVRHAQSAYLATISAKLAAAGIVDGLDVVGYGPKIRLAVASTFVLMSRRLRRGDPTASLLALLAEEEPSCLGEVLPLVHVDECVAECLQQPPAPSPLVPSSSTEDVGATADPDTALPTGPLGWSAGWSTPSGSDGADEVVRSEPRHPDDGIEPDVDVWPSGADGGLVRLLSNRPDKVVWVGVQAGGYWRCLLPWLLEADRAYRLAVVANECGADTDMQLTVRDVTIPATLPVVVDTYSRLHDAIRRQLLEDKVAVWEATQVMPASWCDPEVRASLVLLLAGARGLLEQSAFAPCVWRLVVIVRSICYFHGRRASMTGLSESATVGATERTAPEHTTPVPVAASMTPVPSLQLPAEVHAVAATPPAGTSADRGWIGIRWHEEALLVARGSRDGAFLHATHAYALANSNTYGLVTADAGATAGTDTWVVGADTLPSLLAGPPNAAARRPRMDVPHISDGASTLRAVWDAAERALGTVRLGVLWTAGGGVAPALALKGPLSRLRSLAAAVPGLTILGFGYTPPPALTAPDTAYFSRRRHAGRVWTQSALRVLLGGEVQERLAAELGVPPPPSGSTFLAAAAADCLVLYAALMWGLPVSADAASGWPLKPSPASGVGGGGSGGGNDATLGVGFQVRQSMLLPPAIALRTVGVDMVEVAVDGENKLVLRACSAALVVPDPPSRAGASGSAPRPVLAAAAATVCHLHAAEGGTYERIATGTVEDATYHQAGVRISLGPPLP